MKGFYRIAAVSPTVCVGNPEANAETIIAMYNEAVESGAAAVCFPELSVTGCSCGALFQLPAFVRRAEKALALVVAATKGRKNSLIVGVPVLVGSRLYDAAAVIQDGKIIGAAARSVPANHRGVNNARYFSPWDDNAPDEVTLCGFTVPFGDDIVFSTPDGAFAFGVEIGSDRQCVVPPSAWLAVGGATVIFNPAGEAMIAGDNGSRCAGIKALSERLHAVYVSAGASCTESTARCLYSGHAIIAENGRCLENGPQCERGGVMVCSEVNPEWMNFIRRNSSDFNAMDGAQDLRRIALKQLPACKEMEYREFAPQPFVPEDDNECCALCDDLLRMQSASLAQRLQSCHAQRLVVGLSGGLDSTVALLACTECCDILGIPRERICAVTMPGMGTGSRTKNNAGKLAAALGCDFREVPIVKAVQQHFKDIGHDPAKTDVVYENAQARERTQILMDIANGMNGIVVGTGDLSEIALGWSTFNGDHMAMFGVNCGVPKTLLRAEAACYASWAASAPKIKAAKTIAETLMDIVDTPVSPELLPGAQETEKIVGDYALHDFFLYYFMTYGETPENIAELALYAFNGEYDEKQIAAALKIFMKRFYTAQFKRSCAPEGAAMTPVSLEAGQGWTMPADIDAAAQLK